MRPVGDRDPRRRGYALGGLEYPVVDGNAVDSVAWLLKTDGCGRREFERRYANPGNDYLWSLVQTPDGGYAFAGARDDERYDAWVVRTDDTGCVVWSERIGEDAAGEEARSLVLTPDGYAFVGTKSRPAWLALLAGD